MIGISANKRSPSIGARRYVLSKAFAIELSEEINGITRRLQSAVLIIWIIYRVSVVKVFGRSHKNASIGCNFM